MHLFASPRRGHCASCDGVITGRPVLFMDEAYCCVGCSGGGPCVCTYEADVADDGVDRMGTPFAVADPRYAEPQGVPAGPVERPADPSVTWSLARR